MKNQFKQISYLVFILILLLFAQSCNTKQNSEAKQEFYNLLDSMLTKCDDVYSGKNGSFTIQFKNPTFNVENYPLDESDKLNGVEWKGVGIFSCSSFRLITRPEGIGQWQNCPTTIVQSSQDNILFFSSVGTGVVMKKINGKWQLQSKHQVKPSDCTNTAP